MSPAILVAAYDMHMHKTPSVSTDWSDHLLWDCILHVKSDPSLHKPHIVNVIATVHFTACALIKGYTYIHVSWADQPDSFQGKANNWNTAHSFWSYMSGKLYFGACSNTVQVFSYMPLYHWWYMRICGCKSLPYWTNPKCTVLYRQHQKFGYK
jgi:hypothetical protein